MAAELARNDVIENVKGLIAKAVNLNQENLRSLDPSTALGDGGLSLDSIDVLEIIVTIEHAYGIKVPSPEVGRQYFGTIGGIADFVLSHKGSA